MYRNSYQRGMLTVFFSVGSKPLGMWDVQVQDGYVTRFLDQDIKSMVLEIGGCNVSTTYITCPKGNKVLGITMPFLVMVVKNLKKYFSFEVTILDETGTRRRFRVSNFQSSTQILPLCTVMPIGLSDGWNQIQFNLAEFTRRAYKKQYVEVQKIKVNANIRLRRIYFAERLLPEDKLPAEYKLFFPLASKTAKDKKTIPPKSPDIENIEPSTSRTLIEQPVKYNENVNLKSSKISVHSIPKQQSQEVRKDSVIQVELVHETMEGDEILEEKERDLPMNKENQIEGQEDAETNTAEQNTAKQTNAVGSEVAAADNVVPSKTNATEIASAEPNVTEITLAELNTSTVAASAANDIPNS